jgi:hypothetical protein
VVRFANVLEIGIDERSSMEKDQLIEASRAH